MKVSYQWLAQYVDLSGTTPKNLAERITLSGIEVDIVTERNKGVAGVVVGYVTERSQHPDADKLSVCHVDIGSDETLQIVCGAANVAAGQKVPVAVVGAHLPDGLKIKRTKLRGVESQGMICSARELGIDDRLLAKEIQDGILVLPDDVQLGAAIEPILGLDDAVLELDLTPNRADCLSMLGVAYETAAILDRSVTLPTVEGDATATLDSWQVEITSDACARYSAALIEHVTIAPSPLWLQNRLIAAGVRPINNVVDVTNYVMLEYGQPLHAFDADKVATGKIGVRQANAGESLVTLDGALRTLDASMLVITDGERPIALAGVMGGADTEVSAETTTILLESAQFDPLSVRKTSKELGLRSESSLRFEKGIDAKRVLLALQRAAKLIAELGGGTIASGIAYAESSAIPAEKELAITEEDVNTVLGTSLTVDNVIDIFRRLGFAVRGDHKSLYVTIPSRRADVTIMADLIEEIARIAGYEHIPTTLPAGESSVGALSSSQKLRRHIRRTLQSAGLYQAITYSLTSARYEGIFAPLTSTQAHVALAMPMSEEHSVLRTDLLPSLLQVAEYNANRNIDDIAIYELGKVFTTTETELRTLPQESTHLAGFVSGKLHPAHWASSGIVADFYVVKGIIESVFEQLRMTGVTYEAAAIEGLHPGRGAWVLVHGKRIGYIGELHPAVQKQFDLKTSIVFQLQIDAILATKTMEIDYRFLPRYPAIRRDMALVVDEAVAAGDLLETIRATAGEWLETLEIFDVYQGEHIDAGKKSIAFSLVYRHSDRTLLDDEVQATQERILQALQQSYDAHIRS